jgi:recombination protein RecA
MISFLWYHRNNLYRNFNMAPKKKHTEYDASIDRDELAVLLQEELNKGGKTSYFLDEDDSPSQVNEWVSTGSTLLDLAISNRPNGGLPVGRMVEMSGLEGTGKSLICAQIIAETQRKGGLSVFFDSERAVDRSFWVALGVNIRNVNYVPFSTLEEFFTKMELCIGAFRKNNKNRLLTIFVDSVAQASTDEEMESDHGVTGYNTSKSIIISKAMRKITGLISDQRILVVYTNQLRYNMNAGPFGDKWVVPGGKSLPYACSVRVRLANIGRIKNSNKDVVGMECQAQVTKNRCGPNYKSASFDIMYDSGIQDIASWYEYMKTFGLMTPKKKDKDKDKEEDDKAKKKKTKAEEEEERKGCKCFIFKRSDSTEVEFTTATFPSLINSDLTLKEEVYQAICNNYIMKYRDPNSKIEEDVERTGDENDDITKNAIKDE